MTHISEFSGDETKRTLTLKTPNRTFFLEASTPQECNDWIHAIKNTQVFFLFFEKKIFFSLS